MLPVDTDTVPITREHVEGAVAGLLAVGVVFAVGSLVSVVGLPLGGPDVTLSCAYDGDADELHLTVERGSFGVAETTGVWVLNDGRRATVAAGTTTTDAGLWAHRVDIGDATQLPVEPGSSLTVSNVSATTQTRVVWIRAFDGRRFVLLDTAGDPATRCSTTNASR